MFTGLIEDTGTVKDIKETSGGKEISVSVNFDTQEIKTGESIAVDGACLSVISKNGQILTFEMMNETVAKTCFNKLQKGSLVNMERAMKLNSRLDGHLVSGHIDTTARVLKITPDGISKIIRFEADTELIVNKGSVSINGISLTVSNVIGGECGGFEVSVLPQTFDRTNLKYLKQNDFVNIEYDMIAKYIKKFTSKEDKSKITKEFLIENGF